MRKGLLEGDVLRRAVAGDDAAVDEEPQHPVAEDQQRHEDQVGRDSSPPDVKALELAHPSLPPGLTWT
jgi:hypothetical protein